MTPVNTPRPLLSVVVVGRNDDYMGDYLYRLGTSLSFLAASVSRAGWLDRLEVLVVDWGSERPLSANLALSDDARGVVSFLELSPALLRQHLGSEEWMSAKAVNVGVRRARGEFILFTDSDCLWPEPSVAAIARTLGPRGVVGARPLETFGYLRRYQLPWAVALRRPRLEEWRRLTPLLFSNAVLENPAAGCLGGFSAGQLLHRDAWWALRGYDEALDRAWGWLDNDLMLRATQNMHWVDLGHEGVFGLHMEHRAADGSRPVRKPTNVNQMVIRNRAGVNEAGWGLEDLVVPTAGCTCGRRPTTGSGCEVALSGLFEAPLAPDWSPGPESWEFARMLVRDALLPGLDLTRMAAVAELARRDRPRNLLWDGPIEKDVLLGILKACPGIELVVANPWPEGVSDTLETNPGFLAMFLEAKCRFRGWARVVQGDRATLLSRLEGGPAGAPPYELAWVGADRSPERLAEIVERLAPGGVALVPAPAADPILDCARLRLASACTIQPLGGSGLWAAARRLPPEPAPACRGASTPGSSSAS